MTAVLIYLALDLLKCCTMAILAHFSWSAMQVAKCMIKGMERGVYHLPSPDFGQNLMIAASAGLSPHMFPAVLEFLLAPLVVLALWIFGYRIDNAVRNHADM